jgi:hypothetical protein
MSKKRNTTLVSVSRPDAIASWADRINAALQKTVDGIFETGRQLLAARESLEHGQWERLFKERHVLMSVGTARKFIEIYKRRDVLMANRSHGNDLPSNWTTLYALASLPNDTIEWAHEHGRITADLERNQVSKLRAEFGDAAIDAEVVTEDESPFRQETVFLGMSNAIRNIATEWPRTISIDPLAEHIRREADRLVRRWRERKAS